MSLNETPTANRLHIGIFGKRNAGKSSVINAITGQSLAIVSEQKGTTTDPVYKSMELLPLGPVVIIDTPGLDDVGTLGEMRIRKAHQVLNKTDIALLVIDATAGMTDADEAILKRIQDKKIPFAIAWNKIDLVPEFAPPEAPNQLAVSTATGQNISQLKELLGQLVPEECSQDGKIVADLLQPGDLAILVVPIDKAAPKGRLILPVQQTLRDILEAHAAGVIVQDTELADLFPKMAQKPKLVITDSQAFGRVAPVTPPEILLTSFSILMARFKGTLESAVRGVCALQNLQDGDKLLISEGCTHHRQCNDIGTVKLPGWIRSFTGKQVDFEFTSGTEFPEDLSPYRLILHCGGCMLNEREMKFRQKCAQDQGIPMTNYGIAIAHLHGILKRSLQPFPELYKLL